MCATPYTTRPWRHAIRELFLNKEHYIFKINATIQSDNLSDDKKSQRGSNISYFTGNVFEGLDRCIFVTVEQATEQEN